MWTQCTSVTDGQTGRITITKTVQRIASHGKYQLRLNPVVTWFSGCSVNTLLGVTLE